MPSAKKEERHNNRSTLFTRPQFEVIFSSIFGYLS